MKYLNTIINSFFRTFGRFLFYLLVGVLVYFCINGFPKVEAKSSFIRVSYSSLVAYYNNNSSEKLSLIDPTYSIFAHTRYSGSKTVNGFLVSANFSEKLDLTNYDYFYITGFSKDFIIGSAFTNYGGCESVSFSVSDNNYNFNNDAYENYGIDKLYPFSFKCESPKDNRTESIYLYGSAVNAFLGKNSLGNTTFDYPSIDIYMSNYIYPSTNSTDSQVQQAIQDNTEKLEEQIEEQQKTNEKLDEFNKNITDSDTSGADDKASSFFEDFDNNDYGLSDIITLPLNMIKSITSAKCSPLTIPIPFVDTDLTLPCMYSIYQTYFGDILTIYQTITTGLIAYYICINILALVRSFKDPEKDNVEVMEL